MAEAARRVPGLIGPAWILGLRQTAGRGRRGRPWMDPPGNFAATFVLFPQEPAATVALRSFVAALALFEALAGVTGRDDIIALKWPNDVLLNGAKLAGILLESAGSGGRVAHLSIGFGVNLVSAPAPQAIEPDALRPTALLAETGVAVTPEDFLDRLAPAYARWEALFTAQGFAPIRDAWLVRAARLGQPIVARTGTESVSGQFDTVDDTGALVIATAQGRRAIAAAEVHF
jgi:BirA family transcriptional regulator, biotin operon repressor / biotin---[acetyl-CoA-carboxylase] ligase